MANTSSGGTQAGDKPANTSLSMEIRSYLLKVRGIGNAEALSLLGRAEQAMRTLKARVATKNGDADASQMMSKMAEAMQKISQKMNNLKKKNLNITKKNFVEAARNSNAASAPASQKMDEPRQTLNARTTTVRIDSDADKKMLAEKPTRDLMNRVAVNCQGVVRMTKLRNGNIKMIMKSFQIKKFLKKDTTWITNICESTEIKTKIYVIYVINMMIDDATTNTKQTRCIEKKNENVHSKLKIVRMSWPKSAIKWNKPRTKLRLKIESVEATNKLICENLIDEYE